jgi:hypothetical protein
MNDDEIMHTVINMCDTLDITRIHAIKNGKFCATTIFEGDEALLRVIRAVIHEATKEKP